MSKIKFHVGPQEDLLGARLYWEGIIIAQSQW